MPFSIKQQEYLQNAMHRWNIKTGATASGKTWLDYAFVIPKRVMGCTGAGLIVLIGNNMNTIERNVLSPMREMWGSELVSQVKASTNTVNMFGKRCYVMGADKANQVARIQGTTIEYAYGDEITTWSQSVFEMLKSRLRTATSVFDGTCNPEYPTHWFKAFLDSKADIYHQHYTLDDNPFLPQGIAEAIKTEYAGTVYYDRYVLGKWVRAEGAIYKVFADDPEKFKTAATAAEYNAINIGVDFGGNKSAFAFVATGISERMTKLTVLCSERHPAAGMTPDEMYQRLTLFVDRIRKKYGKIDGLYADSAEQTLINGMRSRIDIPIHNSIKRPIIDRIRATVALMASGRFAYTEDCESLRDALSSAVYNPKSMADERLDDGTSDIDTLDAFEYSFERHIRQLVRG